MEFEVMLNGGCPHQATAKNGLIKLFP